MSNINDFSGNTYKSAVQREMRKVNVNSGCCCNFSGPVGNSAAAELLKNILIDNGVCDNVTENGVLTDKLNTQDKTGKQKPQKRKNKKTIRDVPHELTLAEEALILRAVERECGDNRDADSFESSDNINNTESVENIKPRRRRRICMCFCRRQRERTSAEFADQTDYTGYTCYTNVYRFANQNFLDNLTGRSNIDISNLSNNPRQLRLQIDQIEKNRKNSDTVQRGGKNSK